MRKIFTLLILLMMLPVTVLAADYDKPNDLYVGNTKITSTGYWTSSDDGTNWTSQQEKPEEDSYIYYDGDGTLTLHNVSISSSNENGIYAEAMSDSAVSLTIELEEENKVSGASGIYVFSKLGDASLSISGTGSLTAEGTGGISFSGIIVQGNGGKAELTINNVDVTATNTGYYAQGILLQSADSSPATLTVNGGELTASGQSAGIKYVFGSSAIGDGTPTVTVSGNAIVRANGGISDGSSTDIQIGADSSASSGGIVFDGKNGTVYGDVTLQEDLEIGEGESLTIPQGATLNTNGNLTNNGTIVNTGGTLNGKPDGSGTVIDGSSPVSYLDENGTEQSCNDYEVVIANDIQWTGGWYVAQGDITINQSVTVSDNVHLILEDGCNLTVNGGILLQSGSNMYIYAQFTEKERMGSLTATGTDAGFKEAGSGTQTLTITGGKISASGSDVGISAVNLTITDGYVSALRTDLYGTSIAVYNATISGGFVDLYGDFAGTLSTGIDGHAVISSTGEIKNIAADCKGFFLIQKAGKIYGDTFTLTQDLNIANSNIVVIVEEGQTLTLDDGVTLTIPNIATLTNNGILNNNGTIINTGTLNNTNVLNNAGSIINKSTLTGEVGGNGTVTPMITTDSPLPEGTVGKSYTATLEATGNDITWSLDSGNTLPNGLTLNSDGTITGTPSAVGSSTFTVTATNASGSDSEEYTLTIKAVSVTGVTLNEESLTLRENGSVTLTATVEPADATNKMVTWSSDKPEVATVEDGTVKAVGAGIATITATAADGSGKFAICKVTVEHTWGDVSYTWSKDNEGNQTCTATRTCQNDEMHTESATATVTGVQTKAPTCTEMGEMTYTAIFTEEWAVEQTKTEGIPATGHHYVNGYCTECGHRDPNYVDPISYYNIYVEDVCDGVEVTLSNNVVREGNSISVYVKKDTANYTFDNFHVYYKEGYYDSWDELKEGTQPGEYPIKNIWTHIYIKAEGTEEKEDPTGIESIEGVKVYTKDGSLYVQTPQREQVIIVSMSGAIVKNEEQVGLKQYHGLHPGIYIVRVGDRAYKLRLY